MTDKTTDTIRSIGDIQDCSDDYGMEARSSAATARAALGKQASILLHLPVMHEKQTALALSTSWITKTICPLPDGPSACHQSIIVAL